MKHYKLIKGKIWTGQIEKCFAEAFLTYDDKIIAVGDEDAVKSQIPSEDLCEKIDFSGKLVIPGMTDAHTHLFAYAKLTLYVNLQSANSFKEAMEMLMPHKAIFQRYGAWIRGVNYDDALWDMPNITRKDLDTFFPENPVLISRYCGHVHIANTLALENSCLWNRQDPNIVRDVDGLPTGQLNEGGAAPLLEEISAQYETKERMRILVKQACLDFSAVGVTAIHDCDAPTYALGSDLSVLQSLCNANELPLRVITYHDSLPVHNYTSGWGNDMLMYGGFKIFTDGSVGGRTAALSAPYSDAPTIYGQCNLSDDDMYKMLLQAHLQGIQVQIHVIGDAALEQVTSVLERLISEYGEPLLPYRLNHCTLTTTDIVKRLKKLNVAFDIQPAQAYRNRKMMPLRFGEERSKNSYCFRRLWSTDLPVNSSSDAPIETINPWEGIWTLVCRSEADGIPIDCYDTEEILPLTDAMRTYTYNPWQTINLGSKYGIIAPGFKADFTAVDGDPFTMVPNELRSVKHLATFCNGENVWNA